MNTEIKPTVLDFNDIAALVPQLSSHERLVNRALHWLSVDKVNAVHEKYCHTPGPEFARNLLKDFDITLRIDGQETLDNLPEGAFVTSKQPSFRSSRRNLPDSSDDTIPSGIQSHGQYGS